ncbi:MAG: hypothetical protein ABWZ79_02320 [Pedobacter agri]
MSLKISYESTSSIVVIQAPSLLSPLWEKAYELDAQNGDRIVVVPTKENKLASNKINIRRVFLFTIRDKQAINGEILEILTEGINLDKDLNSILIKSKGDHAIFQELS